jgi:LysM repeat protein
LDTYNTAEYEEKEAEIQYETEIPVGKPAVKEILKTDGIIKEKEIKVAGNKAIVKGNIELSTLYVPDMSEEKLEFIVNEVPFSEMLDIDDVDFSDSYNLSVELLEIKTEVKEDDDGDSRIISQNILLNFKPYTLRKQSFEVVCDAYGLSSIIESQKNSIKINELIEDTKTQLNIKETAILSNMPVPKQIYNITYKPIIDQVTVEDEKVSFGGTVETRIMYLANDESSPFVNYLYYIPFKQALNISGVNENMHPEVRAEVDNFTYNLKDEEVELKFSITAFVRVMNEITCNIITNIQETPLDPIEKRVQPSMTVYYVQSGDTLWNIAKKYLTTIGEITKINSLEDSSAIMTGQQLLIPKIE